MSLSELLKSMSYLHPPVLMRAMWKGSNAMTLDDILQHIHALEEDILMFEWR